MDEGVPVRLVKALAGIECRVRKFPKEWKGLQNGKLLERIRDAGLDCLITCDKNLSYQQNTTRAGLAIVVLPYQRFEDLGPFLHEIAAAVKRAERSATIIIGAQRA